MKSSSRSATLLLTSYLTVSPLAATAHADPLKCNSAIGKDFAHYVQARTKALQKCREGIVKGKIPGPCPDATAGAAIAAAEAKMRAGIAAKCGGADKVCGTGGDDDALASIGWGAGQCPGSGACTNLITDCSHITDCLACVGGGAVDEAIALEYDDLVASEFGAGSAVSKCQIAIGRNTAKFFAARNKALQRCEAGVLKGSFAGPCPDSATATPAIAKAEAKERGAICRACGGHDHACGGRDDLTPAQIGFASTCPDVTIPGGPSCSRTITAVQDIVDCVDCVAQFETDCLDPLTVPSLTPYPSECNARRPATLRIQAEDFDAGGEGVGYYDTTPANLGGRYRPAEAVDIGNVYPDDGTYEVGYIVAGEWLRYTFQIGETGDYVLRLRMAQYQSGGVFHVELDGVAVTPSLVSPDTGTYRHWVTLPVAVLRLTAGQHSLRLAFDQNGTVGGVMNLNWLELAPRALAAPGRIQAEDFDAGGEGIGYHDTTPANLLGGYRPAEGVDVGETFPDDDYSPAVEFIAAGEWLQYTVRVTETADYLLRMRLAQFGTGGSFHVEADGANVTGSVPVPDTTSYANWITLSVSTTSANQDLHLVAGRHTIRVVFDQDGTNGGVMNLNWLELVPESPVVAENRLSGTTAWRDQSQLGGADDITDDDSPIAGFASATSVNHGSPITFYVTAPSSRRNPVTMDIFRMGYYGGANARLMQTVRFAAGPQPPCGEGASGQVECDWSPSYTLDVPPSWPSGVYLAKLTLGGLFGQGIVGNYVPFVVRDDARTADFLYVQPVTTYQAYNIYPSTNCFSPNGDLSRSLYTDPASHRVSFRRPYCGSGAGAGAGGGTTDEVLTHELNLIAFLEREGFDVTYATSLDLHHASPGQLARYRAVLSAGHDEYWSMAMRDNMEEARDRGVDLAFFGANAAYWQVRFEDGDQTMVGYKCPRGYGVDCAPDPYPQPMLRTTRFRDLTDDQGTDIGRPEQWLVGIEYYDGCCARTDRYWPLANLASDSWVFAATPTPITPATAIDLTVGHEIDAYADVRGHTDGYPVFAFDGSATRQSGPDRIDPSRYRTLAASPFWELSGECDCGICAGGGNAGGPCTTNGDCPNSTCTSNTECCIDRNGACCPNANPGAFVTCTLQTCCPERGAPYEPVAPPPGCPPFYQNSSVYQAPSGAWVFATGTLGWALNLANVGRYFQENDIAKKATENVLFRFLAASGGGVSANLAAGGTATASSSYEGSWWSTANVVDGRRNSAFGTSMGYSSAVGQTSDHAEWVEVRLPSPATFSRVILYPRNDAGSVGQGFPIDFTIQVPLVQPGQPWDGISWTDRASIVDYPQPGTGQSFTFAPATSDRVRISATRLRPVGAEYLLQLAEIELY